jgi:peptide chain release factor 3
MNKCDRPTLEPLALLDELERVLNIGAFPVSWPIGNGSDFKGVYDRLTHQVHLFERTVGGAFRAPVSIGSLEDPLIRERIDDATYRKITEELGMLEHAGESFDEEAVLAEKITPVFFGSASNNFGVKLMLDGFLKHSPPPRARLMAGNYIAPEHPHFSGFIFKIQANMDPKHRDRLAFVRICSGRFERDMTVHHTRTGKKVRLSSSHKLFGRERETVDEAYPGDVVGLVGHSDFRIGDTLAEDAMLVYREIPRFTPECFAWLHSSSTAQFKRFREGLEQLLQEGVVQSFLIKDSAQRVPLLGAVGPLQFEVVQYRMQTEYGAESRLEHGPWKVLRWATSKNGAEIDSSTLPTGARLAYDSAGKPVILFQEQWSCDFFAERNPQIQLSALPPDSGAVEAQMLAQSMG